jgi:Arc/MetJ family transcription regulator
MAKVNVSLDAELVVEVMVLSGVRNAQDAVEAVVRDYVVRGHRTEAVTGTAAEHTRDRETREQHPQQG